jgi:hypothetical protein
VAWHVACLCHGQISHRSPDSNWPWHGEVRPPVGAEREGGADRQGRAAGSAILVRFSAPVRRYSACSAASLVSASALGQRRGRIAPTRPWRGESAPASGACQRNAAPACFLNRSARQTYRGACRRSCDHLEHRCAGLGRTGEKPGAWAVPGELYGIQAGPSRVQATALAAHAMAAIVKRYAVRSVSGQCFSIATIRSAAAGAFWSFAVPMLQRMSRMTARTVSELVGGSCPASRCA